MDNPNLSPSKKATVLDAIDPVSQGVGTVTTAWLAAKDFDAILAALQTGVLGTSATVDAKLQQAQDASGTGAKDVAGKAIVQLTQAGADSNKQVLINCRADELDVNGNFTHVRLSVTVAVAASLIAAVVYGFSARYQPAAHHADVKQVVSA